MGEHTNGVDKRLSGLDGDLAYAENDANADTDMAGEVYASVNVTRLRVRVAEVKGALAWEREISGQIVEALKEARIDLSNTRTNIMVDLNRYENARWEGVPEALARRIAAIDEALAKANPPKAPEQEGAS